MDSDIRNINKNPKLPGVTSIDSRPEINTEAVDNKDPEDLTSKPETAVSGFESQRVSSLKPQKSNIAGMDESDPLEDEDILKIDRLQLINASARYQLLSANQ